MSQKSDVAACEVAQTLRDDKQNLQSMDDILSLEGGKTAINNRLKEGVAFDCLTTPEVYALMRHLYDMLNLRLQIVEVATFTSVERVTNLEGSCVELFSAIEDVETEALPSLREHIGEAETQAEQLYELQGFVGTLTERLDGLESREGDLLEAF
jgi:hypothetical protein